jgi:hypothetical protein
VRLRSACTVNELVSMFVKCWSGQCALGRDRSRCAGHRDKGLGGNGLVMCQEFRSSMMLRMLCIIEFTAKHISCNAMSLANASGFSVPPWPLDKTTMTPTSLPPSPLYLYPAATVALLARSSTCRWLLLVAAGGLLLCPEASYFPR